MFNVGRCDITSRPMERARVTRPLVFSCVSSFGSNQELECSNVNAGGGRALKMGLSKCHRN